MAVTENQWLVYPTDEEESHDKSEKEQEELFVFGYACKIFRDDEKAQYIEEGHHLIPWMGDGRLMIDRYDGRGHIYDLSAYDAELIQRKEHALSPEEQQVEDLCDEERYLELRTDVAEKAMYEEEEWKRYYETLSEGYNAVGFSYEPPSAEMNPEEEQDSDDQGNKQYVPPDELNVPPDTLLPETIKESAIIERTANFVAEHGQQMEIVIKTKQNNNPQFNFLNFQDPLSIFYKHMVKMIKSGKYRPKKPVIQEEDKDDDDLEHFGYLHPSLMLGRTTEKMEPLKKVKIPVVSLHETSYGQLVRSMSKANKVDHQRHRHGHDHTHDHSTQKSIEQPPPPPPVLEQPVYGPTHPGLPPPPGLEPVTLPPSNQPPPPGTDSTVLPTRKSPTCTSDDEDSGDASSSASNIVPPPPDIQPVVDRMAMYVAKNGIEFEIVVKSKNDKRFQFLYSDHMHFQYYDFKKQMFIKEMESEKKKQDVDSKKETTKQQIENVKGVSFSIKSKEQESLPLEKRPVFEYGSTDEEHEGDSDGQRRRDNSSRSSPDRERSEGRVEVKPEKQDIPPEVVEKRLAEEKLKDRLAVAARDKLHQTTKEKQLQAERKRKAAMFINLLKSSNLVQNPGLTEKEMLETGLSYPMLSPTGTPVASRSHTPISSSKFEEEEASNIPEESELSTRNNRDRKSSRSRTPTQVKPKKSRSRSPKRRRRKRSPTPPSAYCIIRRSRSRSPVRLSQTKISPARRSDQLWSSRYLPVSGPSSRSRTRSPSKSSSASKARHKKRSLSRSRSKPKNESRKVSSKKDRKSSRDQKRSSPSRKQMSRLKSPSRKSKSSKSSKNSSRVSKRKSSIKSSRSKSSSKSAGAPSEDPTSSIQLSPNIIPTEEVIEQEPGEIVDSDDATNDNDDMLANVCTYKEDNEEDSQPDDNTVVACLPFIEENCEPYSPASISAVPQNLEIEMMESPFKVASVSSSPAPIVSMSDSPVSLHSRAESPPTVNTPEMPTIESSKSVSQYMLSRVRALIKASHDAMGKEDS